MFEPKIKISKQLYEDLEKAACDAQEAQSEEEVKKRLKGLGYLG